MNDKEKVVDRLLGKSNCLTCKHSYRDERKVLRCSRANLTSIKQDDCNDYEIGWNDEQ